MSITRKMHPMEPVHSIPVCTDYLLPALAIVCMGLCCGFIAPIHQWLERVFTNIQSMEMGLGDFIVEVCVPVAGATCIFTTLHVLYQKHQRRKKTDLIDSHLFAEFGKTILTVDFPWKRIAALIVSLVGLGIATWYLTPQIPVLQNSIKVWLGSAFLTLIAMIGFGAMCCHRKTPELIPHTQLTESDSELAKSDDELIEVF